MTLIRIGSWKPEEERHIGIIIEDEEPAEQEKAK